jgi:hypothetical protein
MPAAWYHGTGVSMTEGTGELLQEKIDAGLAVQTLGEINFVAVPRG